MVRLALALAAAILCTSLALAETPEEIFERGNSAYDEERWPEAADAYRSLLMLRIRDSRVEYNLGNTEFRLGNLGRSIVHFERARRLAPADEDIRLNLAYVRSFCLDQVEPAELPALLALIFRAQDRLGPDIQAWFALALYWFVAGVLAWALATPGRMRPAHGWLLASAMLALVLTVASWSVTHGRLTGKQIGVVLAQSVEVLAGPGENNSTLFTVHEGLTLEVRDVREEWIQVSLPNGLHGWLSRDAVEVI
ncbi:MAG: hypothetical protein GY716_12075 [bacterium]|nr:hypothetical protein [bacterium]